MTETPEKHIKKSAAAYGLLAGVLIAGAAAYYFQDNTSAPQDLPEWPKTAIRTAEYDYDANLSLSIKNPQQAPANMLIKLPIICGQDAYQIISGLELTPSPKSTSADTFGNLIAIYEFPNVKPNEAVTITQKAKITKTAFANLPDASSSQDMPASISANSNFPRELIAETKLAIGQETNPLYRTIKIYDWLRTFNFKLQNKPADYETMLKTRTLQCSDAARLMCAMNQTAGLRTTLVSGIVQSPETPFAQDLHSWCRTELPGFGDIHIDPTMGRFPEERACRFAQLDGSCIVLWKGPEEQVFTASFQTDSANQDSSSTEENFISNEKICTKDFYIQINKFKPLKTELSEYVSGLKASANSQSNTGNDKIYPDNCQELLKYIADNPQDLAAALLLAKLPLSESEANLADTLPPSPASNLYRAMKAIKENSWSAAEKLLAENASSPEVEFGKLILYAQTKQPVRALKAGTEALKSHSGEIRQSALDTMVQIFFDLGDWYSAYETASLAASLFPDPNLKLALARAAFKIGKEKEALQIAEDFSKEFPDDGYAWAALGVLYAERGDLNSALDNLQKALAMNLEPGEREYYTKLAADIDKSIDAINALQKK